MAMFGLLSSPSGGDGSGSAAAGLCRAASLSLCLSRAATLPLGLCLCFDAPSPGGDEPAAKDLTPRLPSVSSLPRGAEPGKAQGASEEATIDEEQQLFKDLLRSQRSARIESAICPHAHLMQEALRRQGSSLQRQEGTGLRRQRSSIRRQEGAGLRRQGTLDAADDERELRRSTVLVRPFLQRHGFSDVNERRRGVLRTRCPLHVAVRLLLLAGADAKRTDGAGRTPLMLAQEKDHIGSHTAVLMALMPLPKAAGLSRGMSFKRSPSALF